MLFAVMFPGSNNDDARCSKLVNSHSGHASYCLQSPSSSVIGRKVTSARANNRESKVDIQTIGAWGELLGGVSGLIAAIGVILTLLYLAAQIRQSTELEMLSAWNQLGAMRNESPELMSLYDRGRSGYENLDQEEIRRFEMLCYPQFNIYQALFHQYERGVLTKDVWEAQERNLKLALESPGVRSWLEKNLPRYSDSFTKYLADVVPD